ncbi:VirK/YbjX family protein [Paludibacterium yongneupense]|uniref:VirK/YbjX family protein n=1 Tax=Paludibacterium yongneupense TaxID=400061 RepID=UPI00041195E8|nr:DUF535 family protein [Paludibacterium yongneupense]
MLRTIWNTARVYGQAQSDGKRFRQAKFLLRALLQYSHSALWFRFLASEPELATVVPRQPQWLHKLQRPYLCVDFNTADKLCLLRRHYVLFHSLFSPPLRQHLLGERAVPLARFAGKSGEFYLIELALTHTMDKEGELMLNLVCARSQQRLVTLAFSLGCDDTGDSRVLLGCLQGPQGTDGRERFREVTRDLYGMMPKILMVKALCIISRLLGIRHLLAVSNRGHVHNRRGYSAIRSDYDAVWRSLGGMPAGPHFFALDSRLPARDPATVPSAKRAQYQRRKALETEIEAQFVLNGGFCTIAPHRAFSRAGSDASRVLNPVAPACV